MSLIEIVGAGQPEWDNPAYRDTLYHRLLHILERDAAIEEVQHKTKQKHASHSGYLALRSEMMAEYEAKRAGQSDAPAWSESEAWDD